MKLEIHISNADKHGTYTKHEYIIFDGDDSYSRVLKKQNDTIEKSYWRTK